MDIDADTKPEGSQLLPTLALLVSMASFTSGASFAKRLFPLVGAEGATTLRLVGGSLMLFALLRPWKALSGTAGLRPVVIYGLAMGGMNLLFYMALSRIPLGIAVAIEFSGPLVVTIISSRTAIDLIWVALASIGLLLLLPFAGSLHQIDPLGALMALGAGSCWALYILTGKKAGETHGIAAAALGMGIGALAILPIGIVHAGRNLLRPEVLLIGVGVAFLSSALPYSLEMFALRRLQVRTYGTLTSCEPAIGALAGLLLLNETLALTQIVGIGLIVVAAAGATSTAARGRRQAGSPADLLPE
jgi:inner membrane transporter RhtA